VKILARASAGVDEKWGLKSKMHLYWAKNTDIRENFGQGFPGGRQKWVAKIENVHILCESASPRKQRKFWPGLPQG